MADKKRTQLKETLVNIGMYDEENAESLVATLNLFQVEKMNADLTEITKSGSVEEALNSAVAKSARADLTRISESSVAQRVMAPELADESFPRVVAPDARVNELAEKLQSLSKEEAEDLAAKILNMDSVKFKS